MFLRSCMKTGDTSHPDHLGGRAVQDEEGIAPQVDINHRFQNKKHLCLSVCICGLKERLSPGGDIPD